MDLLLGSVAHGIGMCDLFLPVEFCRPFATTVNSIKTADSIKLPFGVVDRVGQT